MRTNTELASLQTERVAPLLDDGEQLLGTFIVLTHDRSWGSLSAGLARNLPFPLNLLGSFRSQQQVPYTVAITTEEVILVRMNFFGRPKSIARRIPRDGSLGPIQGSLECTITIGGEEFAIPINSIDAARRLIAQSPASG